jgi:hypothetical protein
MDGRAQRRSRVSQVPVGMPAGQISQQPRGLGEHHRMATPAGLVAEGLGDHGLSHPDRAVQDDGLSGLQEPEGGEVPDPGHRDLCVVGEIEVLQGTGLFEVGLADPALDAGHVAPVHLVLA